VVEAAPEIESISTPFEPVIPYDALLDDYEVPVDAVAPQEAATTPGVGLTDEEMLERLEQLELEYSLATDRISDDDFFAN
jgi:hypothetical protein